MDPAGAAELKSVLVGVPLPATMSELLEYAVRQRAEPPLLDALRRLPGGKQFESLDAVAEALLPVQSHHVDPVPHEPEEESGLPPGGDEYTNPNPKPGAVADATS